MTRLIARLAATALAPLQLIAAAGLFAVATVLAGEINDVPAAGLVLGGVTSAAATAAAATRTHDQRRLLADNGAPGWLLTLAAALAAVIPAALAAAVLMTLTLVLSAGPDPARIAIICGLVPLLVTPVFVAATGSTRPVRQRRGLRRTGAAAAALLALAIAGVIGLSETWLGMALGLAFLGPPLMLVTGLAGMSFTQWLTSRAGRVAPVVGLAAGPLRRQRRLIAALSAALVIVLGLAATEAIVGSSFGEREQRRLDGLSAASVTPGSEQPDLAREGPYNDVPLLAATRHQARDRMVPLGVLAVLATLAVTVLALGSTRREDDVLERQGASPALRCRLAALQAAMLSGSAAVFAMAAAVVLTGVAFTTHNRYASGDLPAIALVIPPEVLAMLGLAPLSAALAAAAMALRGSRLMAPRWLGAASPPG